MTDVISVDDLPAAVAANELAQTMIDGANAKASRVAPCLAEPTTTAWAATTDYAVGDQVKLDTNSYLEVTTAGTSGASVPTAPAAVEGSVVDGTVTWKRIGPTAGIVAEAKLILIGAVKRWAEASSGALSSQQAGPFAQVLDTRQRTGFNLWPSEIEALQDICATATTSGAFSLDTAPSLSGVHAPWCALAFGANYCSCAGDIAGFPLYEVG
jgi:hypothetical protein